MFRNTFKNKKVLITGNTGFKGSWLSLWLLHLGADVYGLSNGIPTKPSIFEALSLSDKVNYFEKDVRNYTDVKEVLMSTQPDFLFHMAAQPIVFRSYTDPLETISTNVMGTAHILEALRDVNPKCTAIIITSDKCYDNVEWVWGYKETDALGGKDVYSGSKAAAEVVFNSYYHSFFKDLQKSNVRAVTVRAGNVIGGGDWAENRIVPDCVQAWINGESVEIRSPNATRPWQHVLEPLSGYLTIAQLLRDDNKFNGESYNFGPAAEYIKTVRDLLMDLAKNWNLNQEPFISPQNNVEFHEAGLLKLNCDKALHDLAWLPTLNYEQLIEFTSAWYYKFYNDQEGLFDFTMAQIKSFEDSARAKQISWAV